MARQSRGSATTGPDVKAYAHAASHVPHTTAAPDPAHAAPLETPQAGADAPVTEAEILLGATMWLARVRDWLAEEIDLAPTTGGSPAATLVLRRADLEAFRDGLGRAVALLDGLTVDPALIRTRPTMAPIGDGQGTLQ